MFSTEFIATIKEKFGSSVISAEAGRKRRITIGIQKEAIRPIVKYFYHERSIRFIIASTFQTRKGIEIQYHFSDDPSGHIINLHVILPPENPEIDSLVPVFIGADWIEREMHELIGVKFKGHPDLSPLISEGNWEKDEYPFRKN